MKRAILIAAYLGSIVAAAYAVTHIGAQHDPHGPHVLPVWPGIEAPSGVYIVGLTLVLRDLLQRLVSKPTMVGLILVGAVLAAFFSPAVAVASAVAFAISEAVDYAVFTFAEPRAGLYGAVVASNAVSIVVDSVLFLAVAFQSLQFIEGQVIGKAIATAVGLLALVVLREGRKVATA